MSKGQQQLARSIETQQTTGPAKVVAAVPPGLTPAWFTARELLEIQKVCRDHDGELAERFLKEALKRADRSV